MPSKVVTANTTAQEVAAERSDAVAIPTSLVVDNDQGAADRIISIQDVFTPSVTNGVSSPSETTVDRFRATAPQGFVTTFTEDDLKGVKCLGALKVIASAVDASCYITAGYRHE